MKKLLVIILLATATFAEGQPINAAYIQRLYNKYPVKKSRFCPNCYLWANPYFKTLADVGLHQSIVTYGKFTRHMEGSIEEMKKNGKAIPRSGVYAAWHAYPGYPDESAVYKKANTTLTKPDEFAKGHFSGWELNEYDVDGVLLSDTYTFNAAIERQAQNVGTELGIENLTRVLVGYAPRGHRPDLPVYNAVEYWKGAWGSFGKFSANGITVNYPAVYWNLIKYGNEIHAYWFPNDKIGAGQNNYSNFEIPVSSNSADNKGLVQRLGFDPRTVFSN